MPRLFLIYKEIDTRLRFTYEFVPKIWLCLLLAGCLQNTAISQERNWKTSISKDGTVAVKYDITDVVNEDGKKNTVMYYVAETYGDISLDDAAVFMKDSRNYKSFLDHTKKSIKIETISDSTWLMYLYIDAPWPVPNYDCIQQLTHSKTGSNQLVISGSAVENVYRESDVRRMHYWDMEYRFDKIADGKVKLTIEAAFTPASSIPKKFLKRWIPKGPTTILKGILAGIEDLR